MRIMTAASGSPALHARIAAEWTRQIDRNAQPLERGRHGGVDWQDRLARPGRA